MTTVVTAISIRVVGDILITRIQGDLDIGYPVGIGVCRRDEFIADSVKPDTVLGGIRRGDIPVNGYIDRAPPATTFWAILTPIML